MAEWMYMYSLPLEDHPMGCQCDGCLSHSWELGFEDEDRTDDPPPPDYDIPSPREPGVIYWDEIGNDEF